MTTHVRLLVGTKKGAFILESDADRRDWSVRGPLCEGWPVHDLIVEPGTGAILAAAGNAVVRPGGLAERRRRRHLDPFLVRADLRRRRRADQDDLVALGDARRRAARRRRAGRPVPQRGRRRDLAHVEGLTNHPTRPTWGPGAGGLILHTIIPHPTDPDRTWVGISAVGVFETRDGGASWEPRNVGVRAEFNPTARIPETGQCVHKFAMAAGEPETLYQRNHCGVYRSDDGDGDLAGDHRRPADRLRVRDGDPPARPRHVLAHPAQPRRRGPLHARRPHGGLADARPRRDVDRVRRRPADAGRLHVGPARGDGPRHARPGRGHVRDRDRPALAQLGRGRARGG